MGPGIATFVARWTTSPFGDLSQPPWQVAQDAAGHIDRIVATLGESYAIAGGVAVHRTATVETGATLKRPAIIGPRCFVAATAYLRGGVFLDEDCSVGPGAEVKSAFLFKGTALAHFNFVGDSILGAAVNLEAGSIIANRRNEADGAPIRIAWDGRVIDTAVERFGALIGDGARIGANAVIAPGAILSPHARIARLALVDQCPPSI